MLKFVLTTILLPNVANSMIRRQQVDNMRDSDFLSQLVQDEMTGEDFLATARAIPGDDALNIDAEDYFEASKACFR